MRASEPLSLVASELSGLDTRFEALLAEIGSELFDAPLEQMDAAITNALARLTAFLGIERSIVRLVDASEGSLIVAHSLAAPGARAVPPGSSGAARSWLQRWIRGEPLPPVSSAGSDLVRGNASDFDSGSKVAAVFPIVVGGQMLGSVAFGTAQTDRPWSATTVERLKLISHVFASAVLRISCERRLQASLAQAKALGERLHAENEYLREPNFPAGAFGEIVGESQILRKVLFEAEQVATTDATVLLLGQTGTGKELIAKAIHARSHRRDRTLVKVNCAALPPTLIESELFGHEKGAFTGATARKIGRFELADQGTLFLDEVGELPRSLQAKLLRVLQEGEFERLGSSSTHKVDVRVIAASNRDLGRASREGTFRSDLYYRLGVFPIHVPPLVARKEDIPLLVWHVLGQLGVTLGRKIDRVPLEVMERLVKYDWPGNIRELRNVLERAVILSPGSTLLLDEAGDPRATPVAAVSSGALRTLADVERDHILHALDDCAWRVRGPGNAAQVLGLNASTLYSRMKKLGIRRPGERRKRAALSPGD